MSRLSPRSSSKVGMQEPVAGWEMNPGNGGGGWCMMSQRAKASQRGHQVPTRRPPRHVCTGRLTSGGAKPKRYCALETVCDSLCSRPAILCERHVQWHQKLPTSLVTWTGKGRQPLWSLDRSTWDSGNGAQQRSAGTLARLQLRCPPGGAPQQRDWLLLEQRKQPLWSRCGG